MARSNSPSLKFAIMQHLLRGSRSNVMSSLLFVLSSSSINSGSPCNPSTGMMRFPADIADSGWVLFQLFTTPSLKALQHVELHIATDDTHAQVGMDADAGQFHLTLLRVRANDGFANQPVVHMGSCEVHRASARSDRLHLLQQFRLQCFLRKVLFVQDTVHHLRLLAQLVQLSAP